MIGYERISNEKMFKQNSQVSCRVVRAYRQRGYSTTAQSATNHPHVLYAPYDHRKVEERWKSKWEEWSQIPITSRDQVFLLTPSTKYTLCTVALIIISTLTHPHIIKVYH